MWVVSEGGGRRCTCAGYGADQRGCAGLPQRDELLAPEED
jgi:hypothetical protein